jgi:hypothetical protein
MSLQTMGVFSVVAIQQARAAAFVCLTQQAAVQFAVIEDNDVKTRQRTLLRQCLHWSKFVRFNKDCPLFRRHMRMTHESFMLLLNKIKPHISSPDEKMGALRGGVILPELALVGCCRP